MSVVNIAQRKRAELIAALQEAPENARVALIIDTPFSTNDPEAPHAFDLYVRGWPENYALLGALQAAVLSVYRSRFGSRDA